MTPADRTAAIREPAAGGGAAPRPFRDPSEASPPCGRESKFLSLNGLPGLAYYHCVSSMKPQRETATRCCHEFTASRPSSNAGCSGPTRVLWSHSIWTSTSTRSPSVSIARTSRGRGKLFFRLLEQAVHVDPAPYGALVARSESASHNILGSLE
jgi:hypothetical protein